MQIERVCVFCKQETPSAPIHENKKLASKKMKINRDNISSFIWYKKSLYHLDCFIRKVETERIKKNTLIYKILQSESLEDFISRLKVETQAHFNGLFIKEDIYDFIRERYSITNIPTYIFTKLEAVYSGTLKGMGGGIPAEHLLDMWKRKINELNKISNQNTTKGKTMSASERLSYDLSVLVNKYDSYLKWINKEKIIAATVAQDATKTMQSEKIDFSTIEKQIKIDSNISEKDEMDKYLDELF